MHELPLERLTPPVVPRLDNASETEAGTRWIKGRPSSVGTLNEWSDGGLNVVFPHEKRDQSRIRFRETGALGVDHDQMCQTQPGRPQSVAIRSDEHDLASRR